MQAALVQLSATTDSAENRSVVDAALDALSGPVDLIVLPEATAHDFGPADHDLASAAEDLDGPFVRLLKAHAVRLGATIVAGMFERNDTAERNGAALPFNTLVAIGPDGELAAAYRKVHLYDSFGYKESDRLTAGEIAATVVPVEGRRVGLMTCYDLRFPEYARSLVDAGADVLAVPAAWVRGPLKEDHWTTLLRARAIENTVDVLGAAQCGARYSAGTAAIDPLGVVTAAGGERATTVRAYVDPGRLQEARAVNPSLANRRLGLEQDEGSGQQGGLGSGQLGEVL